jgi:hypothetical protein
MGEHQNGTLLMPKKRRVGNNIEDHHGILKIYLIWPLSAFVAEFIVRRNRAMATGRSAEESLEEWIGARRRIRKHSRELRIVQEQARVLEQECPWIGSFKGTLRKKDGDKFDIPEGPKTAKVPPRTETQPGSSKQEKPLPRRPSTAEKGKRKAAPLLEKSRREAEVKRKRTQDPPPRRPQNFNSEGVFKNRGPVIAARVPVGGGTCGPPERREKISGDSSSAAGEEEGSRAGGDWLVRITML